MRRRALVGICISLLSVEGGAGIYSAGLRLLGGVGRRVCSDTESWFQRDRICRLGGPIAVNNGVGTGVLDVEFVPLLVSYLEHDKLRAEAGD